MAEQTTLEATVPRRWRLMVSADTDSKEIPLHDFSVKAVTIPGNDGLVWHLLSDEAELRHAG
jgi:hypothetical protein